MATMRDVAQRAGVSYTTVSFVLNQRDSPRGIGAETRRRVLKAAEEMQYRPNALARAMVTGRNRMLGFVTRDPGIDAEFKMRVQAGILEEASSRGYTVKVLYFSETAVSMAIVEQCLAWRLAGVIAVSLSEESVTILEANLAPHGIVVATVEGTEPVSARLNVRTDEAQGMRLALDHLVALGHRRIAHLSAGTGDSSAIRRTKLFCQTMHDLGLPLKDSLIVPGHWWDVAKNERAALQLLRLPPEERPTAVLCCGDPAAMVLLNVGRSLGLRTPEDISVIGFGDYTMALYADPALTTVTQPFREVGRAAASRLIDRTLSENRSAATEAASHSGVEELLPTRLAIRSSTAETSRLN